MIIQQNHTGFVKVSLWFTVDKAPGPSLFDQKVALSGFEQKQQQQQPSVKVVYYRALYPFDARSHDEISITPGDVIMVRHSCTNSDYSHYTHIFCSCIFCVSVSLAPSLSQTLSSSLAPSCPVSHIHVQPFRPHSTFFTTCEGFNWRHHCEQKNIYYIGTKSPK